tara:strand:+ start:77620 stop:78171 length:552 start_codon:yes stop_codon:yes gene_type:complete
MKKHWYDYCVVGKHPVVWTYTAGDENTPRKVVILDCDFDKRCTVKDVSTGEIDDIKWGYLFHTKEAFLESTLEDGVWDCINPHKCLLSNKNKALVKKMRRKECDGYYSVGVLESSKPLYKSKFLSKCLKKFFSMHKKGGKKYYLLDRDSSILIDHDGEEFRHWVDYRKGDSVIKNFHHKKYNV